MSESSNVTISVDVESRKRKYHIIENSVTSVSFQMTEDTVRYVYSIHTREVNNCLNQNID